MLGKASRSGANFPKFIVKKPPAVVSDVNHAEKRKDETKFNEGKNEGKKLGDETPNSSNVLQSLCQYDTDDE